jgi:hypothetical protein
MPLDTATLALEGEVPLAKFAEAVKSFHDLITGLSDETGASGVAWMLDDLSIGSAIAVIRGDGPIDQTERVVRRLSEVSVALEQRRKLTQFSPKVQRAASRLRRIPGGPVRVVRLQTEDGDVILHPPEETEAPRVVGRSAPPRPLEGVAIRPARAAFGAVQGRVQMLSNRRGLRFTLYESINDRAVQCYLAAGQEDIMRDAWNHLVVVEGWVSRDPLSGQAIAIRDVRTLHVLPERPAGSYRLARGAAPSLSGMPAEVAIRRLRDA